MHYIEFSFAHIVLGADNILLMIVFEESIYYASAVNAKMYIFERN